MKNAIRCCIACILPCGALDVIRIVHTNGKVEEISGTHVKAAEIMKLHPKHVLKKPSSSSSSSSDEGSIYPKIVIVPPDAELKRGKIYFLMPMPPSSSSSSSAPKKSKNRSRAPTGKKKMRSSSSEDRENGYNANLLVSDQYLSDILLEKVSTQRDRRRGRVGFWRPHLESIYETPSES
ncbi:PREDICTED: uncharacterized protein LOC109219538 [Nicotiana attenuata]|uniref:Uncharacterized protein n=1 Tax=Nicotiana attenuata TaxID=49451 RepID=A0A1J6JT75_NICAT|nr:PREDICTED: uncharacterized protein LOC109219538 [Nicotiana attenuata]OIT20933.1 hypothetical protein A4A49_36131 [Nicotiana attenuata]